MISGSNTKSPLMWVVHLSVVLLVLLWTMPTIGLFVSSIRDKDQLAVSGWWTALFTSEQNIIGRTIAPEGQLNENGVYILKGNILEENGKSGTITAFGWRAQEPTLFKPGETAQMRKGQTMSVKADGSYVLTNPQEWTGSRGKRIFHTVASPPIFTLDNYHEVLTAEGIGQSFINSLTVTIPSTIIPILIAAFAAYALAWMQFPGRAILIAVVVGLLVVPLQMSLIPLLQFYNQIGAFSEFRQRPIWGSGLPIPASVCRSQSTCCAIISPSCQGKSSNPPGSTGQAISISSSRSSCRFPSRRWHPLQSSSSSGSGTICWSRWCFWEMARINWC